VLAAWTDALKESIDMKENGYAHPLAIINKEITMMKSRFRVTSLTLAFAGIVLLTAGFAFSAPSGLHAKQTTEHPSDGFSLHVDALGHFPGDPQMVAHHWCKQVAGGLIECQLYDSDAADAHLVGTEVIVDAATFEAFDEAEQAQWHYHRQEIPAVQATLPDLSPEEAAKVVESLQETYGKVYLFWDPAQSDQPVGEPSVVMVHGVQPATAPTS
jgi:hypothetical protein